MVQLEHQQVTVDGVSVHAVTAGLADVTLVGHDIGGMVAYACLRQFPDLSRVVIAAPAALTATWRAISAFIAATPAAGAAGPEGPS